MLSYVVASVSRAHLHRSVVPPYCPLNVSQGSFVYKVHLVQQYRVRIRNLPLCLQRRAMHRSAARLLSIAWTTSRVLLTPRARRVTTMLRRGALAHAVRAAELLSLQLPADVLCVHHRDDAIQNHTCKHATM